MSNFITSVHVNKIFHLNDLEVPLSSVKRQHLLLTGKNGSGKTSLLNAIMEFIEKIYGDKTLTFLNYRAYLQDSEKHLVTLKENGNIAGAAQKESNIQHWKKMITDLYGKVDVSFKDITSLHKDIQEGRFIVAYYNDMRRPNFVEHDYPKKPDLSLKNIKISKVDQFLDLLTHYQLQTVFAQLKDNEKRVSAIGKWFAGIEKIFRELFGDPALRLDFDSDNYKFYFVTEGKRFKFTELSAGYSAALDIISDLIF